MSLVRWGNRTELESSGMFRMGPAALLLAALLLVAWAFPSKAFENILGKDVISPKSECGIVTELLQNPRFDYRPINKNLQLSIH